MPPDLDRTEQIAQSTAEVVRLLVAEQYRELVELSGGVRLSQSELRIAVHDYGRALVMPPAEHFHALDVVRVTAPGPPRWSVNCDLWTTEEGRSDLTLELTLVDCGDSKLAVEIDGLHVL